MSMLLDRDLALAVLGHIEQHPESHDQWQWVHELGDGRGCGTVACFAGWAVVLAGGTLADLYQARLTIPGRTVRRYFDEQVSYSENHLASVAMTLLGLDVLRAHALFHEDNTIADLRRMVGEYWPEPAPATPEEQTKAFSRLWDNAAVRLRIVSFLLASLAEDEQLYERVTFGTEPAEQHRLKREVEEDLIAARTWVDNIVYYVKVSDAEAAKEKA